MKKHVHESDDNVIRNYDAYDHVLHPGQIVTCTSSLMWNQFLIKY